MIRAINSKSEIEKCVRMYMSLNDPDLLSLNYKTCYDSFYLLVRKKKFVRVFLQNDEIIAWIYCDVTKHLHLDFLVFQQLYFASNQQGMKAYKCVVKLHEAMLEEAKRLEFKMAISTGSHMDPDNVFTKILEKQGWKRRGYMALKML